MEGQRDRGTEGGRPACSPAPLLQTRKWEESRNEGDTLSPATLFPNLKPTVASGPDTAHRLGLQLQNCVRRGVNTSNTCSRTQPRSVLVPL